jgi:hypothetical protein
MKFLRQSFLWILLIGAVGLWVYKDVTKKGVCETPIRYSLGTYDARFNISKTGFKSAIDEAAAVWEEATGKNLFDYEPNPEPVTPLYTYFLRLFHRKDIPVNLVYDERQQNSETRRTLISQIETRQESVETLKNQITTLEAKHKQLIREYEEMVNEYRKRRISFQELEAKRLELNSLAEEINSLVKRHNSLVGQINPIVRTVNQTAGQEFEEGKYELDENGERITIFEFADRATLVRVLAHEFGHALGLDHNDNPNSIMYYLNESENLTPTKEDIAPLLAICKGA